jgi:hypothetical protein
MRSPTPTIEKAAGESAKMHVLKAKNRIVILYVNFILYLFPNVDPNISRQFIIDKPSLVS